ncbi:hypothetical protein LNP24_05575 [Klebsiella pneumoniae subsp. pneumoniae]|nr:hypothetical protein [Klebsiella pneumoniae subsp. pneumoniae]
MNGDEYLSGLAECFHLPEARIKMENGRQQTRSRVRRGRRAQ